jgi:callose synthase
MWNAIITSFREEDLIDNREKDLLLVPDCKDRELDIFQWPPFLLASKVDLALSVISLLTIFVDSAVYCLSAEL